VSALDGDNLHVRRYLGGGSRDDAGTRIAAASSLLVAIMESPDDIC
jgi:hypothetical protein